MATAKKESFQPEEVQLAAWAKAIGHPARIAILKVLSARNTCICGEIVDELPLAQATVSQHLKALKAAGLVEGTIDGPRSCYCINWDTVAAIRKSLDGLFDQMNEAAQSCC